MQSRSYCRPICFAALKLGSCSFALLSAKRNRSASPGAMENWGHKRGVSSALEGTNPGDPSPCLHVLAASDLTTSWKGGRKAGKEGGKEGGRGGREGGLGDGVRQGGREEEREGGRKLWK